MQQQHLSCILRHLTPKVSMVTVVLVLSYHTIRQTTRPKRFENHQKQNFTKKLRQAELALCFASIAFSQLFTPRSILEGVSP